MQTTITVSKQASRAVNNPDLLLLAESCDLANHAANLADKTRKGYMSSVRDLLAFLADKGMPLVADNVTREHVELHLAEEA